jgi:plasmid maintenance system antidote protein VapI
MRSKITNIQFEKAMHDMRYTNMRLAKHLEVHPSIISKWLRGDRPSDENMLKLEFVFGKRVAYWWIKKSVQGKPVDVYQAKDVVKCIDDLNIKGIPNIGLTKGVLYRVEDVRGLTLLVKDDYGAMIWYAMSRFQRAHVEDVVVQSKPEIVYAPPTEDMVRFMQAHIVDDLEEKDELMYRAIINQLLFGESSVKPL